MSNSFTNQVLAQIELWNNPCKNYEKQGFTCYQSISMKKVARLHLAKIGVELDELSDDQASYLGIPKAIRSRPIITGIKNKSDIFEQPVNFWRVFVKSVCETAIKLRLIAHVRHKTWRRQTATKCSLLKIPADKHPGR